MFTTTINRHPYGYKPIARITQINTVVNPAIQKVYDTKRTEMSQASKDAKEIFAFHGTPKDSNIDDITRHNFDLSKLGSTTGNKGWYGSGVYLTRHAGAAL